MLNTLNSSANMPEQIAGYNGQLERYALRLYVTGTTARSMLAIKNIRQLCEKYLADMYDLEVIDIYQHPEVAAGAQIIAAPTLIKLSPLPLRRAIGDMSNEEKVLFALNLPGSVARGA